MFLGRVPLPGEPLWTEQDRAWAIALLEYEADLCSGCGQPRSESMRVENDGAYVPTALRCYGCVAVADESERFTSDPHSSTKGLMIGVELKGGGHVR